MVELVAVAGLCALFLVLLLGSPSVRRARRRAPSSLVSPDGAEFRLPAAAEALEDRTLLSGISDDAFDLLHNLTVFNQQNFFVYQDGDSAFNHGFPSGFFAGPNSLPPARIDELIQSIDLDLACVDDPNSLDGCSDDANHIDRERGTIARITLPDLEDFAVNRPVEFVGVSFEDPEQFGETAGGGGGPVGVGYDLTGATRVLFDARSPNPGGVDVQFGVAGRNTDRNNPVHLSNSWTSFSIPLNSLRNPDTNAFDSPDLSNVHVLFSVVITSLTAPDGGTILLDNIRFDPVPNDPTGPAGQDRLSLPLANQPFGVVPAVIHAIDDSQFEFTTVGNWTTEENHVPSYQNNRHTDAGTGPAAATWTFRDLEPREYVVQATWSGEAGNASNARYEIFDKDISRSVTLVDQRVAPAGIEFDNDSEVDKVVWQTIGTLGGDAINARTLRVELSNAGADGTVVADGVRIVPTIPPDQAIRNLTTVYESALTVFALLDRGTAEDRADARLIADTLLYALAHDNTGGGGQLPTAPDGSRGLRDAYAAGDIALFNDQGPGALDAKQDQARLVGFSSDKRLCGDTGFCLVLDGAFGGNNAFGVMALMSAYTELGDAKYLNGAREIGNWIYGNLADPNGPAFPAILDPGDETFGGYFLGYPDQGVPKDRLADLLRGKSIENNADIFAAFTMIAAAERQVDNGAAAAEWERRANIAGDFVMEMYDAGDPQNDRDGHFSAGALPVGISPGPGLDPSGPQRGSDVINVATFLDSNTFITLALARSPRYRDQIDWREPTRFTIDTFHQEVDATTAGQSRHYEGFSIFPVPTGSNFRPGEPIGGLPNGIAWEFAAQAVVTMEFVDWLYGTSEFQQSAADSLSEIRKAQLYAPYGDGLGLVAATLNGENDNGVDGYAPLDQCLGTPFQCIAERVGLAATTWAIFADAGVNIFAPQWSLPQQTAQEFVVDDWNNKVTENDTGFNYFGGNMGRANSPEPVSDQTEITGTELSNDIPDASGQSLKVDIDFGRAPTQPGEFGGIFASLFGLTDTKARFDGGSVEPTDTTLFPGVFLDFDDVYQGFGSFAGRSIEQITFDLKLDPAANPFTLKVELKDEASFDVFTRVDINNTNWETKTFTRADFDNSFAGLGNVSGFDWNRVSVFALIVENEIFDPATNTNVGMNPSATEFFVDNLTLVDNDGQYPDLDKVENAAGDLDHLYEAAFLDYVRESSSRYFVDFAATDDRRPTNLDGTPAVPQGAGGIIQDRSTFADLLTVGGVGFQLTSYVIDAERGYLSRDDVANRVRNILKVLHDSPQGPERVGNIGHQGFFYHFLGADGRRKLNFDFEDTATDESKNTVELSTIDTALAIAGVVTAGEYFGGSDPIEQEIRTLANSIYGRVNWRFMLNEQVGTKQNQFYLGWKPVEVQEGPLFEIPDGTGQGTYSGAATHPQTLDCYTDEALLTALLAMGSPNPAHRIDRSVWDAILRTGAPDGTCTDHAPGEFVKTFPGALFTYQFFSVWADTEALGTDNHHDTLQQPSLPLNFFDNTRKAIEATRASTIRNANSRTTWSGPGGDDRWGLSAAEGPYDSYEAHGAAEASLFRNLNAEAESGAGDGTIMVRGNASGELNQTVQLDAGESRTMTFDFLALETEYEALIRYSNDNFGSLETIEVRLDGSLVGAFSAIDTGDGGAGWDNFVSSVPTSPIALTPGAHTVTVSVSGGDGFGVEIDRVLLRALETGTSTVYGVGASIKHAPELAIPALWESQELDLLHPRFGFADAFNLDIADHAQPATPGSAILRTSGPWANFNGFSIDHGPMLIMIDNYLHHDFVPQLFMGHTAIAAALQQLFPAFTPAVGVPVIDTTGVVVNPMPDIHWAAAENATAYDIRGYSLLRGIELFSADGIEATTFKPPTPLDDFEVVQVYVRATRPGSVGDWSVPEYFTIDPLGTPAVTGPFFRVREGRPLVTWTDVNGALSYDVLGYNVTTGQQEFRFDGVTDTDLTPPQTLQAFRTWSVYVRANGAAGPGEWSRPLFFVTEATSTPLAYPPLTGPSEVVDNRMPTFSWEQFAGALSYRLEVYSTTLGRRVLAAEGIAEESHTDDQPLPLDVYRVYVRANLTQGNVSQWSVPIEFEVIGKTQPPGATAIVTPVSPTLDATPTFIWLNLPNAGSYTLAIYDPATGREVLFAPNLPQRFHIPMKRLAPGVYTVFVRGTNDLGEHGPWSTLTLEVAHLADTNDATTVDTATVPLTTVPNVDDDNNIAGQSSAIVHSPVGDSALSKDDQSRSPDSDLAFDVESPAVSAILETAIHQHRQTQNEETGIAIVAAFLGVAAISANSRKVTDRPPSRMKANRRRLFRNSPKNV